MPGKRKTEEDYRKLAQQRGFKWHGSFPNRTDMKTLWECDKGHRWKTAYRTIYRGSGCPHCLGKAKKVAKDYHALAAEKGFKWIGPMPCNAMVKTWWECQKKHRWEAPYRNIQSGRGCPDCYWKRKLKIAIEYDSWYWHGNRLEDDKQRDQDLLDAGWRILHVRSNNKLPTWIQLNNAIAQLQSGKVRTEIVLDDWGHGSIFTGFT